MFLLKKIKHAHLNNGIAFPKFQAICVVFENKKKSHERNTNSINSKNYYQALQSLGDSGAEIIVNKAARDYVLPITVLKCSIEQIHQLCKSVKIIDAFTRKISNGLKTSWSRKNDSHVLCGGLDIKKLEFFTHTIA
uniref:Uncharacterized protein n=1 Tax=Glossina austeni TaxID=7395 RepID=A0A1A9UPC8_GLOAU